MALKKIGTIVNFFGLKGQLKVSISTSQPEERFKPGKEIIIKNTINEDQTFIVKSLMMKNSRIAIIGLEGYNHINDIQWMIGKDIMANVRAPKGSYFFDDLVGMKVLTQKGEEIGVIDNVMKMPAGDYLVIQNKIFIPFLLDKFILSVDKKSKTIVLTDLGEEAIKQ